MSNAASTSSPPREQPKLQNQVHMAALYALWYNLHLQDDSRHPDKGRRHSGPALVMEDVVALIDAGPVIKIGGDTVVA